MRQQDSSKACHMRNKKPSVNLGMASLVYVSTNPGCLTCARNPLTLSITQGRAMIHDAAEGSCVEICPALAPPRHHSEICVQLTCNAPAR
mmetsp:Transcript_74046/g.187272  ORF Transcript_74046/g.187272 Transcript_74046/m.187272 type:complete len:90 (-) Transcript_74046:1572-1841(-)